MKSNICLGLCITSFLMFISCFFIIDSGAIQQHRRYVGFIAIGLLFSALCTFMLYTMFYADDTQKKYGKIKSTPEFKEFINERFNNIKWTLANKEAVILPQSINRKLEVFKKWQKNKRSE